MAGNYDIKIEKGADYDVTITWGNPPVNLTGYTAKLEIRDRKGGSVLHDTLTESDGITLGGAAGTIAIHREASETAAYTFQRVVYDLVLIGPTPTFATKRLLEGQVILDQGVTV